MHLAVRKTRMSYQLWKWTAEKRNAKGLHAQSEPFLQWSFLMLYIDSPASSEAAGAESAAAATSELGAD